jgi:hypothetical protein
MITKETATDIALTYREIENAEKLLAEITDTIARREAPDIRDAFGRRCGGLELGVPSGDHRSTRLFQVDWALAAPVIKAHIAGKRAELETLMITAAAQVAGEVQQ